MNDGCPECGRTLVPTAEEGVVMCLHCEWSGDAPEPTGPPLDITTTGGKVSIHVPDPSLQGQTRPLRFDADAARRLAEALEIAANDADRQEERYEY